MTTISVKVTTDYVSHPVTGKGQIKAVATGVLLPRTVKTVGYSHEMNALLNHRSASYEAVYRMVQKLGGSPTVAQATRTHDVDGNGHHEWTYTVEV